MALKTRIKELQYADTREYIPQVRFLLCWFCLHERIINGPLIDVTRKTKDEAKAYIKNKYPDVIFHYPL